MALPESAPRPNIQSEKTLQGQIPPGPKGLPVVGNLFAFEADRLGFLERLYTTYGDISCFFMLNFPLILLTQPEHIKYVLTDNPRNFTSQEFNADLSPLFGKGLLTSDGEFHRQQRRLMQPAFHKKRVESYAQVMVDYTQQLLNTWKPEQRLDVATAMQELTLRIVAKTLLNVDLKGHLDELGNAFTTANEFVSQPFISLAAVKLDIPFLPYGHFKRAEKLLNDTVYGIIAEHRASGVDTGDVVSMLLASQDEDGSQMTDTQIHDQVMTLFGAGHETTANLLSWTFYLLSQYPVVRQKLVAEIQEVLNGDTPDVDSVARMPYLEQVISEALRLYPPAWAIGRRAIEAFDLAGYSFPAGTMLMMSQWVTHRLPQYFPDPEVFQPERFTPENRQKLPHLAYFPFGAGPRICIGMPFAQLEAKLLLATILSRYTLKLVPGFKVVPQAYITLRPKYGMQMIVQSTAA